MYVTLLSPRCRRGRGKMEISISGARTIETAQNVLHLCRKGDYRGAKKCLVEVKKSVSQLVNKTKDAVKRLKHYDAWLTKEFTKQAEEKNQLYIQIRNAEERVLSLNARIQHLNSSLRENARDIESAKEQRASAERKKEDAEDKLDGISSPLVLIPGYALYWGIRELIEDNSDVVQRANNEIESCYNRQRQLEQDISNAQRTIRSEEESIRQLKSNIQQVTSKCTKQESTLSQTRRSMSIIVKALQLYTLFAEIGVEAIDNTSKLETVMQLAVKFRQEIESSGASANYEAGWDCMDELLQGEISGLSLAYTCSSCGSTFKGIPWLKDDEVYCEKCNC